MFCRSVKRSLKGVNFVLEGQVDKETLKSLIEKHGGHVSSRVSGKVAAVISTPGRIKFTTDLTFLVATTITAGGSKGVGCAE